MKRPVVIQGSQVCVAVHQAEIKIYGNAKALASIANQLKWLSQSAPEQNNERHIRSHMLASKTDVMSDDTYFVLHEEGVDCLRFTDQCAEINGEQVTLLGLEVTFMNITEGQMEALKQHRPTGLLPDTDEVT